MDITETLAYSIQNTSIDGQLPNNEIINLIEHNFQTHFNNTIKYYYCLVLCALTEHHRNLSDSTLEMLKVFAQPDIFDDDNQQINLRNISIKTLETYINVHESDENLSKINEIKQCIEAQTSIMCMRDKGVGV